MEFLSFYPTKKSQVKKDVSIVDYIGFVKEGANQDLVINARAEYQKNGKTDLYNHLKGQSQCVTGSAVMNEGAKTAQNIKALNGLICIDIDGIVPPLLAADKYTYIYHKSFSGDGVCVFVKILPDRFEDSFDQLAQYYYENFNIPIDQSCKNKNRLRYISYDPDLIFKQDAQTFKARKVPKKVKKVSPIIHVQSDFDHILQQIQQRGIDLVKGEYDRFVKIGFALYNGFGDSGKQYLEFINQFNPRFKPENLERDWKGFRKDGSITISTFYHYAKEEGIEIYTQRTKDIINKVHVAKSQGSPTIDSVNHAMLVTGEAQLNEEEKKLAQSIIDSKEDFSKVANEDRSEIELLEEFIITNYEPKLDLITNINYIKGNQRLTDAEVNDIYIKCKKHFDFNVPVQDVRAILNSNSIAKFNSVVDFFKENTGDYTGYIEDYVRCIEPYNDFNVWAFKKWIVGAIHNWTSSYEENLVCPLTLVLTGRQQGTGKTSFLRNCLPEQLKKYYIEAKIDGSDKDSNFNLCAALLVLDDEFGGQAFKDVKAYKSVSDQNIITQRRPYEREAKAFKRRAILCGTSNEVDILKDVTGNRRILPIKVDIIRYDDMLKVDKTKMLVEAYNLYKSGFNWIIRTQEELDYLDQNTTDNKAVIPLEEVFFKYFSLTDSLQYPIEVVMNQGDIMEFFLTRTQFKPSKYDIREIIQKNKLDYKPIKRGGMLKKGILLYQPLTEGQTNEGEIEPF
jgi:hypothetical protein